MQQRVRRLEKWLQILFQLPDRRLGGAALQPTDVVYEVEKVLERGVRILDRHNLLAPNDFTVGLHPSDFQALSVDGAEICAQAEAVARRVIGQRGYLVLGAPFVHFVPTDEVRRGHVTVTAIRSRPVDVNDLSVEMGAPKGSEGAPNSFGPVLKLADTTYPVCLAPQPTYVGRATDNQVTLTEATVSRHHALIRSVDGQWLIEDLESRNGTRIDGHRLRAHEIRVLRPGAHVSLGLVTLIWEI